MRKTGRILGIIGMAMAAQAASENAELNLPELNRLDSYRPYVGGFNYFRGMKIGGVNKHFNKKRHGKMLRRKHKRS